MRKSYADYLREQGATDEEIKILDTPPARKAYDAMMTQLETANNNLATATQSVASHKDWYENQAVPAYNEMEQKMIQAQAEAARANTILRAAQERGLIDVALLQGHEPAAGAGAGAGKGNGNGAGAGAAETFDPTKHNLVTYDRLLEVADREGDAIAAAQDIAAEHATLFPGRPLSFRDLRKKAVQLKKTVEQVWMEDFKVAEAREAKAKKDREDHDAKMRAEGAAAERERLASQYGNPDTRPLVESTSPLTARKQGDRAGKQPWEVGAEDQLSTDRVTRATKNFIQKQGTA